MRAVGVYVRRRGSLRVEESARAKARGAGCFALSPLDDVRLISDGRRGREFLPKLFREAGRANQLARASRELSARTRSSSTNPTARRAWGSASCCAGSSPIPRGSRSAVACDPRRMEGSHACAIKEMYEARRARALVRGGGSARTTLRRVTSRVSAHAPRSALVVAPRGARRTGRSVEHGFVLRRRGVRAAGGCWSTRPWVVVGIAQRGGVAKRLTPCGRRMSGGVLS